MTRPPFVRSQVEDAICQVQLDRPDRLNAVSEEVYADLEVAVEQAAAHPDVRVLLLSGAGRAFCAGADLKAHAGRSRSRAERRAYVWAGQRVCRLLQRMPQPVVAAVQGHAIGAGAELAISADVVVCAEDAQIRFPEVALGTFVGGGASRRLPLVVGHLRAQHLLLLGRALSGSEAVEWGLATEAVPAADLQPRALELARRLADQPPLSSRLAKEGVNRAGSSALDEALVFEAEGLMSCMDTDDWSAAVDAFGDGASGTEAPDA